MTGPQTHTTMAVGEEDPPQPAPKPPHKPKLPDVTTMAVGEEDDPDGKLPVTTLAVGEEDEDQGPRGRIPHPARQDKADSAFGSF